MRLAALLATLVCLPACSAAKFTTVSNPGFDGSADSAVGDGGSGSDAGPSSEGGCTPIDGGRPVVGSRFECAMTSCDPEVQYCCVTAGAASCVDTDAGCAGVAIQCVDTNNCQDLVCCGGVGGTSCQRSCPGTQFCRSDCDCPNHDCQLYTCTGGTTFETCGGVKPEFCL